MRIRFDRGTLVVDRAETGVDREILVGGTWDAELAAWRLPADRLSGLRVRLAAERVRFTDNIRTSAIEPAWSLPPLRWYQTAALGAWRAAGGRGVLALPTGSGKTLVALAAIAELGVSTLCLVPTRVLLDQWARVLAEAWPFPIGRLGDGDARIAPVTVSTYASAVSWAPRIGDRFGLVVVDEAHHVGGWCPGDMLEMLVAPARLGLTATPPAGAQAQLLERHVGRIVYGLGVAALTGDALADFDLVAIPIALTPPERERYRVLRGEFGAAYAAHQDRAPGAPWREFVAAARRSPAGRRALAAWRASRALLAYPDGKRLAVRELLQRHTGERVLVFTADNATAYAIARELLVFPVTCDIGRTERADMIESFRAGAATVLVSSQVLDEGFDLPDADIAIVVGGTGSQRRHVQRVGRVLRPRAGKRARVYELAVEHSAEQSQVARRRRGLSASLEVVS